MSGQDDVDLSSSSSRPPVLGKENCGVTGDLKEYYPSPSDAMDMLLVHARVNVMDCVESKVPPFKDGYERTADPGDVIAKVSEPVSPSSCCEETDQLAKCWEQASADVSPTAADESGSTPSYLRWNRDIRHLLHDAEGVILFKEYLEQEKCDDGGLGFWFACEGFRNSSKGDEERRAVGKLIFKKYIKTQQVAGVAPETRLRISEALSSSQITIHRTLFDDAQRELEEDMMMTTYPNFFESDVYLRYVRQMQDGESPEHANTEQLSRNVLPTLHEDVELSVNPGKQADWRPSRLKYLDSVPRLRPEAEAGLYLTSTGTRPPNPYHVKYSSYLPTSIQDSELQSVSSDARTDDTLSLTDASSVDYGPVCTSRSQEKKQQKLIKQSISLNKDHLERTIIPRTQRLKKVLVSAESNPEHFAALLTEKLTIVKQNQEKQDRIQEHIRTIQEGPKASMYRDSLDSQLLFATLKDKLPMTDESNQSILDEHVSRVWDDSARQTPEKSPGWGSPQHCHFPRWPPTAAAAPNYTQQAFAPHIPPIKHRKECGFYSNDVSVVHEPPKEDVPVSSRHIHKHVHHYVSPSGAVPPLGKQNCSEDVYSNMYKRYGSNSKRASTTVPTDCTSSGFGSTGNAPSEERVYSWVLNTEKFAGGWQGSDSEKDSLTRHKRSAHSSVLGVSSCPTKASKKTSKKPVGNAIVSSATTTSALGTSPSSGHSPATMPQDECTVIGYRFSSEEVPYRTKLPGKNITLKQFKALLMKKGNYRYFFKKASNEFGTDAVLENVVDDNKILPLWENKIFCIIEPLDVIGGST